MSENYSPEITHELREPLENGVELFTKIFYATGSITRPSKFARSEQTKDGRERPMFVRHERAKTLKAITENRSQRFGENREYIENEADRQEQKDANQQENKKLLQEAKLRDLLAEQYLTQKTMTVATPELGAQQARLIDLNPATVERKNGEHIQLVEPTPIVLIPGVSNDVECVGSLALEMAMQGRRVIVVGYPESFNGYATQKFADAVNNTTDYSPHVAFFKSCIEQHLGSDSEIELWGYSTGAPIAAEILSDQSYQERTTNATFVCPASSVEQSVTGLLAGGAGEAQVVKNLKETPNYMWSTASKTRATTPPNSLRNTILVSLLKSVAHKSDAWQDAKVQDGGKITVVSGTTDSITKSEKNHEWKANKQMALIHFDGHHLTPLLNPRMVLTTIAEQSPQAPK